MRKRAPLSATQAPKTSYLLPDTFMPRDTGLTAGIPDWKTRLPPPSPPYTANVSPRDAHFRDEHGLAPSRREGSSSPRQGPTPKHVKSPQRPFPTAPWAKAMCISHSHHLNRDPLKHCSENDSCVNMEVRARLHVSLQPCRGHLKAACRPGRPSEQRV